jgi:predicted small lipoprotein YifL
LYGADALGILNVNRNYRPKYREWTLVVLGAAVLALGGCGRKGPLDLPQTTSSQPVAAVQGDPAADPANKPSVFNPSYGADTLPSAGKGPKRPFVLDPLLNSN